MALENVVQEMLDNEENFMVIHGKVFPVLESEVMDLTDGEYSWNVYTSEEQK